MRILFMGRKPVAARILRLLAEDSSAELVGVLTDSHLANSVTADAAQELGIPIFSYKEALAAVERGSLRFDLGISVLYWRKIQPELLSAAPLGIINFHPAPLPEYKGVGGYNLAILAGLDEWAASAHYIDDEIDTGNIIRVRRFAIDPERETARSLERKSVAELYDLFLSVWRDLTVSQDLLPSYANVGGEYLNRTDLEAMKRIDVEKDDIDRKIRAFWFPPYDGAFIQINGERFTLVNRHILEELADPEISSLFSPKSRDEPDRH